MRSRVPHTHALCTTQDVVRFVKMQTGQTDAWSDGQTQRPYYKNTKNIRPIISLRLVDFYVIYIRVCFISQVKSSV